MSGMPPRSQTPLLRHLNLEDAATIKRWPPYSAEFDELDYALREDGWIAEFYGQPNTWLFAAVEDGALIGFTILATTAIGEAEFRIALRADKSGQGLGQSIAASTIMKGFGKYGLARIHLLVRKNNLRAIELYRRLGFTHEGECHKTINNRPTDFLLMGLLQYEFNVNDYGTADVRA